jgi:hypothetical protein
MQVTETLNEGLKRGYAIKLPAGELESKVVEKLEEARKDFQMKGFRKGKAPTALMKKMFGKSVLGEAMQESIDKAMRDHFEASGDRPALQPEVKMTAGGSGSKRRQPYPRVVERLTRTPRPRTLRGSLPHDPFYQSHRRRGNRLELLSPGNRRQTHRARCRRAPEKGGRRSAAPV